MFHVYCSFADLQKPQVDFDGKACAAVGQNNLMALYDTLFSQVLKIISVFIIFAPGLNLNLFLDFLSIYGLPISFSGIHMNKS